MLLCLDNGLQFIVLTQFAESALKPQPLAGWIIFPLNVVLMLPGARFLPQIPTGHGALRCLIPVAFRGGGESKTDGKKLKVKNGSSTSNGTMRLPIGTNGGGKKGTLITATPTTFKENPIKANVPVIREFSVTPLAYRRFDASTG